ncbi:MAG: hypothetical protein M3392_01400 [Actinomycetota bacterium]|nr:hypothetical protein [Actinomycetota bacterium]
MRKLVVVGAVIALISLLLFGRSLRTPEDKPLASQVREDTPEMVDLSGPKEGTVGPERGLYEGSLNADDPELVRSHPTSRRGKDEEYAYQEAVDSFADYYRDTINETNPLVHLLVMQSRGEGRMTEAEAEDLNAYLLELEKAPEFGAVESYPKGYEDCSRHLGAGAVSLDLAADSIRGFNETTDADYLKDYQALIGMYLQAVADAKSCVSDHLYPAYP